MAYIAKKRASRSPNYPSFSLEWAVTTALKLMELEGLHAVPEDIVAKHLNYKDASNGKARRVLAALRAYGIVTKPAIGKLAVSKEVQLYKLAPDDSGKVACLKAWIKSPPLFEKLLEKYSDGLPSDAVLLFELVDEHGFNEVAAKKVIEVFHASLEFIDKVRIEVQGDSEDIDDSDDGVEAPIVEDAGERAAPLGVAPSSANTRRVVPLSPAQPADSIRYPIRLTGGRMAYIDVPMPFYENDKKKLASQIEIIGTEDEDDDFAM